MSNLFTPPHLLLRRRQMMMSKGVEMDYITDGLIFHLDAIDKGGDGTTWVDKIGGIVFDNHGALFGNDYVEFDGASYLQNLTASPIGNLATGATIEAVLDYGVSSSSPIVFMQNYTGDYPTIGFYNNGTVVWYTTNGAGRKSPSGVPSGSKAYSISGSASLIDGVSYPLTGMKDYWGTRQGNGLVIGGRTSTENLFAGKLYSVRIYNRELSLAEMLSNQQVDNTRFNLGLSI